MKKIGIVALLLTVMLSCSTKDKKLDMNKSLIEKYVQAVENNDTEQNRAENRRIDLVFTKL